MSDLTYEITRRKENRYNDKTTLENMQKISKLFNIRDKETGLWTECISDDQLTDIQYGEITQILIAEYVKCYEYGQDYKREKNVYGGRVENAAVSNIGIRSKASDYIRKSDKEIKILEELCEKSEEIDSREKLITFQAIVTDILNNLAHYCNNIEINRREVNSEDMQYKYFAEKDFIIKKIIANARDREEEGLIVGKSESTPGKQGFLIDIPKVGQLSWHLNPKTLRRYPDMPKHPYGLIKADKNNSIQNIDFIDGTVKENIDNEDYIRNLDVQYFNILTRIPRNKIKDVLDIALGEYADLEYEAEDIELDDDTDKNVAKIIETMKMVKEETELPILIQLDEICDGKEINLDRLKEVFEDEFTEIMKDSEARKNLDIKQEDKTVGENVTKGIEIIKEICEDKTFDAKSIANTINELYGPILEEYRREKAKKTGGHKKIENTEDKEV